MTGSSVPVDILVILLVIGTTSLLAVPVSSSPASDNQLSPAQTLWKSIGDSHKTTLEMVDERGCPSYQIELAPANETTLGEKGFQLLNFILGREQEWRNEPDKGEWKKAFLIYISVEEAECSGGWFDPRDLVLTSPSFSETWRFPRHAVKGPLANQPGHPLNYSRIKVSDEPLTGLLLIPEDLLHLLDQAHREGSPVYLHYRGSPSCCSRALLTLSGLLKE
ncbi:MAG: hypothetical protein ACOCZX_02530 [Candidatus Bipolaricaulota bacterium]